MSSKTLFRCSACSAATPRWSGQCPACQEWNTLTEGEAMISTSSKIKNVKPIIPTFLIQNNLNENKRLKTGIDEFDRVLGGGLVAGSLILIGGEPGIGKSTLTLQAAINASNSAKVLIFSGEESAAQIGLRYARLEQSKNNLHIVSSSNTDQILATLMAEKPTLAVVDSIQVLSSENSPGLTGSVSQIRYATEKLLEVAKTANITILIIGHVTKSGDIAGPQLLSHLVDVVLQLEGEKHHNFRLLRGLKNRFGATDEVGVFEMSGNGMIEVKNPSAAFLEGRLENAVGSVIFPALEGTRAFLVEIQALTNTTPFGYPRRTTSGIDLNRVSLLLAVLAKHARIKLDSQDVFVNVVGGIQIDEPAADLSVVLAIASSKLQKSLPANLAICGEVGLSGELRTVSQIDKRIKEAEKLGFERILIPKSTRQIHEGGFKKIKIMPVRTVMEALRVFD